MPVATPAAAAMRAASEAVSACCPVAAAGSNGWQGYEHTGQGMALPFGGVTLPLPLRAALSLLPEVDPASPTFIQTVRGVGYKFKPAGGHAEHSRARAAEPVGG